MIADRIFGRIAGGVVAVVALALSCSACHRRIQVVTPTLQTRPPIWIGFVVDSVREQLLAAQKDTVETAFQVTSFGVSPQHGAGAYPQDSLIVVRAVIRCSSLVAEKLRIVSTCPNPYAPRVHTHVRAPDGMLSTCSPTATDWQALYDWRREFDVIMCGDAPPTFYFASQSPLRGMERGHRTIPRDSVFRQAADGTKAGQ